MQDYKRLFPGVAHSTLGGTGIAASEPAQGHVPPSHPRLPPGGSWPLYTHMAYGPLLGSVPTARARTMAVLREWGTVPTEAVDDVLLVVSELVSNGVQASLVLTLPRPVQVWVYCDGARVQVQVGDESHAQPICIPLGEEASGGRGLIVVAALSERWGWFPVSGHGLAKIVWAEIPAELRPTQRFTPLAEQSTVQQHHPRPAHPWRN
jgi:Histidine kinase-like ATPase domain